jgi:hypothetical protein
MPAEQRILAVAFRSPDGRRSTAIGGGATVDDAISFAREACPDDTTWQAGRHRGTTSHVQKGSSSSTATSASGSSRC